MSLNTDEWIDRRSPLRGEQDADTPGFWMPERSEVVIQFFTRYLFVGLALVFFATLEGDPTKLLTTEQVLIALGCYALINTVFFYLALKQVTLWRIRGAMAADLLIVTLAVIHDPHPIPPAALAFLMVLLGNGMRYGMRLFAEVLAGAMLGMAVSFVMRYRFGGFEISAGDVFFGVFWIALAMYAYLLMGRIDAQRRQLDFRSRYDALTGLLNRHGLLIAADHFLGQASPTPTAVLFADLNEFKSVNDQFGHGVGDRVLSEFARIFMESTECRVCGRWGGDEFVAVLPHGDAAMIGRLYERIHKRIDTWKHCNSLPMSVSLGVAYAPKDGSDLITLLSVADIHLYQHKASQQGGLDTLPHMAVPLVRKQNEPKTA